MRSEFKATLKKAEYLKRNLKPNDSCPPAEKSIYESALQMGRDGAVAEVLHNFSKAESLYVRSSQLLQLLTMDASHPSDKAVLESCTHQPTPLPILVPVPVLRSSADDVP